MRLSRKLHVSYNVRWFIVPLRVCSRALKQDRQNVLDRFLENKVEIEDEIVGLTLN